MPSVVKNIAVCVSGGIAAYKSLSLIRLFKTHGCNVKTVATENALQFVTPLSLETLSQNPVYCDTFDRSTPYNVGHVALADWADAVVVAPATANIIGKYANGIADDALSTFLLAVSKPVFVAPAMNTVMYNQPAVQENIMRLEARGVRIIRPVKGQLACGSEGDGRMEEPEVIFNTVLNYLESTGAFANIKAVVTAGPTHEQIDPVRFIGNNSSGKMGFALAEVLASQGAEVTLISGPTHLQTDIKNIHRIDVRSAAQMEAETVKAFAGCDVAIMAAAVADFTPKNVENQKIKKTSDSLVLELVKTTDILAELGKMKKQGQTLVGFALETNNELENAVQKLKNKNADFIVLNSLKDEKAGFGYDTNKVTILGKSGVVFTSELKSKKDIARDILDVVMKNVNI
ncbi:MAG: bifunctional phosphopantothenoylcysteine decarboxylase/phosphopantothenate--cysteine ligase CoaBC [Bacteroidales bacterium]|nr:bifunctional phosphopantothenoylcysteine decarboxylase/phosphopantothenate--cysteine ligase CoaBC [Bacteroidales bacterium]